MTEVKNFEVRPVSMLRKDGMQRVQISAYCRASGHFTLEATRNGAVLAAAPVALPSGRGKAVVFLPAPEEEVTVQWILKDAHGQVAATAASVWTPVLNRTFYIMVSSHTDIGLHNSQYIQRYNSVEFSDQAAGLCDATQDRDPNDRYRYTMEGTWFWGNYAMERGDQNARLFAERYLKTGKIGICGGVAGNHTQVYGLEEMCRSAYEKRRLHDRWGIDTGTLSMIDNNGISMGMIQPYADAGYRNIIFAPNHWNPLPSTVWHRDTLVGGATWNPDANGGGARMDVRYDSELPMVFFWENQGRDLLVWCSTQYDHGGRAFGLTPNLAARPTELEHIENCMAEQLPNLDAKYPYGVWLLACYQDDQTPDIGLTNTIREWNWKWAWPKLRTLGDPNEPFTILREKHAGQIPHLSGDITGGWYQHPLATPELLAQKFGVDRALPTAEKWASVAALVNPGYQYPTDDFRKAWDYLLYNDEHSYGTSGYAGRRVYETWMQHRDWIEKAQETASRETDRALKAIADRIPVSEPSVVVFNPTAQARTERIELDNQSAVVPVPAFGYAVYPTRALSPLSKTVQQTDCPPVIENKFYTIRFHETGAIRSIYDKELGREILDTSSPYGANTFLYTKDNHRTFSAPEKATFEVVSDETQTTVTVHTRERNSGAEIQQKITLPKDSKWIDLDNTLRHVSDLFNKNRYYRYAYYAFPFHVEGGKRLCHLNGAVAEYASSVTGHGTDVYMAAREWACVENREFGVALMQLDSSLIEFDHIHPDKTDFGDAGDGSNIYCYLANDWLQMHTPGGSHLDYRFRYRIVSYSGSHRTAGIAGQAELYANPVSVYPAAPHGGNLAPASQSFFTVPSSARLLCLKRADDGNGLIARLYGTCEHVEITSSLVETLSCVPATIDERPADDFARSGFITCRIGQDSIHLPSRPVETPQSTGGLSPIGSVYTGLITKPRAACGEDDGQLYLLWGKNPEPCVSHYNLYRGESPDFTADERTLIAQVQPEKYCVGRYIDTGLKTHTTYYYRVCAVAADGTHGPLSDVFSGITREVIPDGSDAG